MAAENLTDVSSCVKRAKLAEQAERYEDMAMVSALWPHPETAACIRYT